MTDLFTRFWDKFPHRENRGSKPRARKIFEGKGPTESGRMVSELVRDQVMEGLRAHLENVRSSDDRWKFRQSAPVWLYQESWETALEIRNEREQHHAELEAQISEADRELQARRDFTRAFKQRQAEVESRGGRFTIEDYRAELARSRLRVVGEE